VRERLAEFEIEERDGVLVARIGGEIDSSNAAELRLALTDHLPNASTAMILDLSRVGYIDSSGIQLLFDLGRRLAARRQTMRLVVPQGSPTRRVLELCDVGDVAPLDAGLEAALGSVSQ